MPKRRANLLWYSASELNKCVCVMYCQKVLFCWSGAYCLNLSCGKQLSLSDDKCLSYTGCRGVQATISSPIVLDFNRALNVQSLWLIWQQNLIVTWTHLVAKPVLNWFEVTYTSFSPVWILNIHNFCWKSNDVFITCCYSRQVYTFPKLQKLKKNSNPKHILPYGIWEG